MAKGVVKSALAGPIPYYVIVPFVHDQEGDLWPSEPQEAPNAGSAKLRARAMLTAGKAGAIAFTRTCNPQTGDFSEPVVLLEVGEVDRGALCE